MCRSWGFSGSAIGISIVLGGVFATVGKVLLAVVGLVALVAAGRAQSARRCATPHWSACSTLVAVLAVFVW